VVGFKRRSTRKRKKTCDKRNNNNNVNNNNNTDNPIIHTRPDITLAARERKLRTGLISEYQIHFIYKKYTERVDNYQPLAEEV
jgi:hypothetical protein